MSGAQVSQAFTLEEITDKLGTDLEEWLMNNTQPAPTVPPHPPPPGPRLVISAPARPRVNRTTQPHPISPGAIEKLRRQDMKKHLSKLASFVPKKATKTNRASIIEQAVEYIQSLQKEYKELSDQLQCMKKVAMGSDTSSEVDNSTRRRGSPLVNVEGLNVFVTVCSPRDTNQITVLAKLLDLVQSYQLELASASISTDVRGVYHHLHAKLKADSPVDAIRQALHDL